MNESQFQVLIVVLTDIFNELKKANKRPLYIVVNNQETLKELAQRIREDQSLIETDSVHYLLGNWALFTYGERWRGDQVRYEVHDNYSRPWIDGKPIEKTGWEDLWDQLFKTEAEAQAEIRTLKARFQAREEKE